MSKEPATTDNIHDTPSVAGDAPLDCATAPELPDGALFTAPRVALNRPTVRTDKIEDNVNLTHLAVATLVAEGVGLTMRSPANMPLERTLEPSGLRFTQGPPALAKEACDTMFQPFALI
jgi:hypothetical protein